MPLVLILCFCPIFAYAQATHHWSQQCGAVSTLLGGAVVGGVRDNSAIFYNPAALSLIDENRLSVSANAYKFDAIQIKNGAGTNLPIDSYRLSLYPQFISNVRSLKQDNSLKWGYALLTRNQANIRLLARHEKFYDVLPDNADKEEYIASFERETQLNEIWLGTGIGYKINPYWAVGISQFIAYRNQNFNYTNTRQAIPIQGNNFLLARASDDQRVIINNFSLIWKIGLSYQQDKWHWGTSLTLPSQNIFGFSFVSREIVVKQLRVNLPLTNGDTDNRSSFLGTAVQRGVSTQFKTPLSWAIGSDYQANKHLNLCFTTEWFAPLKSYRVVRAAERSFIRPSYVANEIEDLPTAAEFLAVTAQARSVINVALGIKYSLSDKWSWLAGFRTNYNYYQPNQLPSLVRSISTSAGNWNLYQLSSGISLRRKQNITILGIDYGFSNFWRKHSQYVNYTEPQEQRFLVGNLQGNAQSVIHSINLIIGFSQSLQKH